MRNIVIFCLLFASLAFAQKQRMVVIPSIPDKESVASKKVTPEQLMHLDNRIHAIATNILVDKGFYIVPKAEVEEVLYEDSTYQSKCGTGGSCVKEVIEKIIEADFGTKLNVYMVNEQLYMNFELYGKKTGSRVINPEAGVNDFAEIQAIIEERVPAMFINITKTEREICEADNNIWENGVCKTELDREWDKCDEKNKNDKNWIWRGGACIHEGQMSCEEREGKWIENKCKEKEQIDCESNGKEWHNGVCRDVDQKICVEKNDKNWIWDGNDCIYVPERDCKNRSGMVWIGNACITVMHEECLKNKHIWHEKKGFCRDPSVPFVDEDKKPASFYAAVALDVVGAGFLIYGLVKHFEASGKHDDYKKLEGVGTPDQHKSAWKAVENAQSQRDLFYILGTASLGLGVGIHIIF